MSFLITCVKFISILMGLITYIVYVSMYFKHDYNFSVNEKISYSQILISLFVLILSIICYTVAGIIFLTKLCRKHRGYTNAVMLTLIVIMLSGLISILVMLTEVILCTDTNIITNKCISILYNGVITLVVLIVAILQVFTVPSYILTLTGFVKSVQICKC